MSTEIEVYPQFQKIHRLSRRVIVTEKLDGTNSLIYISDSGEFKTGSRTKWISPFNDNHGFSRWAHENKEELMKLGYGHHYGEFMGLGIQRTYNLKEKRFVLFNTEIWSDDSVRPKCCYVTPILYDGIFDTQKIDDCLTDLKTNGSKFVPGFMRPEGIVVYHVVSRFLFKKTIEKDDGKNH